MTNVTDGISPTTPLLDVRDLSVAYTRNGRSIEAVRSMSLTVGRNETVGLVGESGSGKSSLALAIMGYLGSRGLITAGSILLDGEDLTGRSRRELEDIRGRRIAMVHQDPHNALNPSIRIGEQIAEVLRRHLSLNRAASRRRTYELLDQVNMPDAEHVARAYPHQLSGGMKQRAVICMALACDPDLLIMDEPTTGLDVTTEATVLDLVAELRQRYQAGILYITHDLGVVTRVCSRVMVMYAGQLAESGDIASIFDHPAHPYTEALLRCVPRPDTSGTDQRIVPIRGHAAKAGELPVGCVFEPRCDYARDVCRADRPSLDEASPAHWSACHFRQEIEAGTAVASRVTEIGTANRLTRDTTELVTIERLEKRFGRIRRRFVIFGEPVGRVVHAVNGVDFQVHKGETYALVGESGSGKTTIGRCVVGLEGQTAGVVRLGVEVLPSEASDRHRDARRALQIVFQNPHESLNPRHTVAQAIGRPLRKFRQMRGEDLNREVERLLLDVRLDSSYMRRHPDELSGGEKQRVAIARALAGDPALLVCDETVSALDVSVQAAILNLLADLQRDHGISYLFISHDLGVVRQLATRIGVIYLGNIVEEGTTEQVFEPPYHPYTEALLSSIPIPTTAPSRHPIRLEGPIPSSVDLPTGCPFNTRCHRKIGEICEQKEPPWQNAGNGHGIYCHIPLDQLRTVSPVL